MSGKGSSPRPYSVDSETFASNWERAFGKSTGARLGSIELSKSSDSGAIPDAPAIYINPETGEEVGPDWWPDITTG